MTYPEQYYKNEVVSVVIQGFSENKDNFCCNAQFSWRIFLPYTYVIKFSAGYILTNNKDIVTL